jgi:outer membrane beta-barrel protein
MAQEAAPSAPPEQVIEPELERREVDIDAIDTEDFFVEGSYGLSQAGETSFEILSGAPPLLSDDDRDYSYYNIVFGYNIFPGEAFIGSRTAFTSAFYLVAGAGSTEFGGDEQFTITAGFGYRLLLTDSFALHADFRDHIFDSDLLGVDKTTHNLEASLGLSLFF